MNVRASEVLPYIVAALVLLVVTVYYAQFLSNGPLRHIDEYTTLDRTNAVIVQHDWTTVYSNNVPTFKKPPLQYWMGAVLLKAGVSPELATRLPSFLFGLGVLALTAVLTRLLAPDIPWAAPIAVLFLAVSAKFWRYSVSALLDNGSVFFAYGALIATILAMRNPRWWYLVAAACTMGALHKAPIALAFSIVPILGYAIAQRWTGVSLARSLASKQFRIALVLLLVGLLLWPALQVAKHGMESLNQAYVQEMVQRISPFSDPTQAPTASLPVLLSDGEPFTRFLGVLALFWLPWTTGRRELWVLPTFYAGFVVLMACASGFVSPRYSLLFQPMLMAALAVAAASIFSNPILKVLLVVLICATSGIPLKGAKSLGQQSTYFDGYIPFLRNFRLQVQDKETLLLCPNEDRARRLYSGALSYYASAGKPFYSIRSIDDVTLLAASVGHPPIRGICSDTRYAEISARLVNPQVVETFGGFTHWRADGVK